MSSPAAPAAPAVSPATRPIYYSDGDTRPTYRGSSYRFVRRTGLSTAVLACYLGFALRRAFDYYSGAAAGRPFALLCRVAHAYLLHLNVVWSDDLHNYDLDLGRAAYTRASSAARVRAHEQWLHAVDWAVAITLPISYHVLYFAVIRDPAHLVPSDYGLAAAHLLVWGSMCYRITPALITPKRPLFGWYAATFCAQIVVLLLAFRAEFAHHPWWIALWVIYAGGLLFKGIEWPDWPSFGQHEMMHLAVIIGNLVGLVIDVTTSDV